MRQNENRHESKTPKIHNVLWIRHVCSNAQMPSECVPISIRQSLPIQIPALTQRPQVKAQAKSKTVYRSVKGKYIIRKKLARLTPMKCPDPEPLNLYQHHKARVHVEYPKNHKKTTARNSKSSPQNLGTPPW